MTTIEQIEKAVQGLSERELAEFRAWFAAYDRSIGAEALTHRAGLVRSSIRQHDAGESRDGFEALNEIKKKIIDHFGA